LISSRVRGDSACFSRIARSAASKSLNGSVCCSLSIVHWQTERDPSFAHESTNVRTVADGYG
jgi:hypothetical protein